MILQWILILKTSLSSDASNRKLPADIIKSLVTSAVGWGAGSSGAYVNLRMARCTVLLQWTCIYSIHNCISCKKLFSMVESTIEKLYNTKYY